MAQYDDDYKREILEELDNAPRGGKQVILEREGLYSTTVANWRKQMGGKVAKGRKGTTRGRKKAPQNEIQVDAVDVVLVLSEELNRLIDEHNNIVVKMEKIEKAIAVLEK